MDLRAEEQTDGRTLFYKYKDAKVRRRERGNEGNKSEKGESVKLRRKSEGGGEGKQKIEYNRRALINIQPTWANFRIIGQSFF